MAQVGGVRIKNDSENRGAEPKQARYVASWRALEQKPATEQIGTVQCSTKQVIGPNVQRIKRKRIYKNLDGPKGGGGQRASLCVEVDTVAKEISRIYNGLIAVAVLALDEECAGDDPDRDDYPRKQKPALDY